MNEPKTPNLGLNKIDRSSPSTTYFDLDKYLDQNWEKVDEGVATKQDLEEIREAVGEIDVPDASLTQKGKVQLSNAVDSDEEISAATPKAVKIVMNEALSAKQLGVERKANVVAALNSIGIPASTNESWDTLINKLTGVIRATGNATAAQVLVGATFSNASANGVTGTMPNRGGGGTIVPSNVSQTKPFGYYSSDISIAPASAQRIADIKSIPASSYTLFSYFKKPQLTLMNNIDKDTNYTVYGIIIVGDNPNVVRDPNTTFVTEQFISPRTSGSNAIGVTDWMTQQKAFQVINRNDSRSITVQSIAFFDTITP